MKTVLSNVTNLRSTNNSTTIHSCKISFISKHIIITDNFNVSHKPRRSQKPVYLIIHKDDIIETNTSWVLVQLVPRTLDTSVWVLSSDATH